MEVFVQQAKHLVVEAVSQSSHSDWRKWCARGGWALRIDVDSGDWRGGCLWEAGPGDLPFSFDHFVEALHMQSWVFGQALASWAHGGRGRHFWAFSWAEDVFAHDRSHPGSVVWQLLRSSWAPVHKVHLVPLLSIASSIMGGEDWSNHNQTLTQRALQIEQQWPHLSLDPPTRSGKT